MVYQKQKMTKDYEIDWDVQLWGAFVSEDAIKEVENTLRSQWLNTGKQEKLLRKTVCEKFNIPYCLATNNCTASLRATYAMLGVGPGDEVISTPYAFIATNTAILEQGAKPIFADIKYDDINIDPKSIREKITDKTRAISCVHFGGNPCDMDEIREIGKEFNLPIIEDCAHALGSKYKGSFVGSKGDLACFSLQVVKIITCGDGGLITTTKKEYYEKLKKYIWYGIDRDNKEMRLLDPLPDDIIDLGFKYNMNDIIATLALHSLKHIEIPLKRRKEIGEKYREELKNFSKVQLLNYHEDRTPNYQLFPIHVENRLKFAKHMRELKIQVNVNNMRNDKYTIFGGKQDLPNLEKVDGDTILIPIHANLTDEQVDKVIKGIKDYDKK